MSEPDFRPRAERPVGLIIALLIALAAAGWFGWQWWQQRHAPLPPAAPVASTPAPPDAPSAVVPAPAAAPTPQNQVAAIGEPDKNLPALGDSDARVRSALVELLGSKAVGQFLQLDDAVRRLVATVDNLPREQAPVQRWPVRPTDGRFQLQGQGEARTIAPDNAARYTPFVLFAENLDAGKVAGVYARLYPLFQQAYEELGYPGRYFNDRLVAVIDHLLAAPEPAGPVQIRVVEVRSEVPGDRPWVRYEYADPRLQSLSAGQKLMVRVGLVNERRLKAKLRELRGKVATVVPASPGTNKP
ncbi:DUF3014 domain-containing protein [Pseudacidovorax sp. RU35E]|uniref:DUF3014 domain-containing protein n=1 Tax=Pseudacidovorax sp. RU35E TaxID=1907403 RepID=UPI000954F1B5|nr:DUF3014 domain-containing protein [Pseudacidovorax sp. RU35E]SIP98103.1 Protein of unknown function [Pseudacidovorax sp. RU35E]